MCSASVSYLDKQVTAHIPSPNYKYTIHPPGKIKMAKPFGIIFFFLVSSLLAQTHASRKLTGLDLWPSLLLGSNPCQSPQTSQGYGQGTASATTPSSQSGSYSNSQSCSTTVGLGSSSAGSYAGSEAQSNSPVTGGTGAGSNGQSGAASSIP
ncbi:hypothetical protein M569_03600 [Genlisea aurea]|uniref:Uncharacterized protein n=1 Tax=Genlisea aurea TaxID=192259 RepID=S8CUX1_9LAMI|nr:hypothetical protein M569_03600 [Genlisea aurea]